MKTKTKRTILLTLSFIIPLLTLFIAFYLKGILKNRTLLASDMYDQYYPLFNYLKELLDGKTTLFYSFNKSMGGTMFGTFFYYLSSPLNLLIKFVSKNNVITFMTILVMVKISLCGLTMYLYMSKKFKSDNIIIMTFSIAYALMGYNINYYINIMWLDIVFMTPLILIGLENIIDNKSPLIYIITLLISIISNYYISYMTCIFLVIYFIYEILQKYNIKNDKNTIKKIIRKFTVSSLLSGLMCAFFIIPCLLETKNYGRVEAIGDIFAFSANYLDIMSKSYLGALNLIDPLNYTSMNIYCGTLIFILTIFYFGNINISKKERKLSLLVIILLILPCFVGVLNYVWHLFTIPQCFSYRYSFLLCLFAITLSYKNISNLYINKKNIYLYLIFYLISSLCLIPITFYGTYYEFLNYKKIWITIAFMIINLNLLYRYNKKRPIKKYLVIITIIELILNLSIIISNREFMKLDPIYKKTEINEQYVNKYYNKEYRLVNSLSTTFNDSLYMQYNTPISFLSTTNSNYLSFLLKDHYSNIKKTNVYLYKEDALIDSLIGNKTIITADDNCNYDKIEEKEYDAIKYYIYDNKYALKLGFLVDRNLHVDSSNDIDYMNNLYQSLSKDHHNYIETIEPKTINQNEIIYKIETKNDLLIFWDKETISNIKINGKKPLTVYCEEDYCRIKNEYYNKLINITYEGSGNQIKIRYKKKENIEKLYNNLKKGQINIEELKDNYLKGTINVSDDEKNLLLTIGYEKGFKIFVDGNEQDYNNIIGFVGIDLEKGNHEIILKYEQPYLKLGIIISTITGLTTILYLAIDKKTKSDN